LPVSNLSAALPRARRIAVAIVDDAAVVRGLFARWLSEAPDIEVVGLHRNGLEALRQVGTSQPDVIILDLAMPEMDGLQALPMILQLVPRAKILVVSSMSRDGTDAALRCLMRGAAHYLPKPSALDPARGAEQFRHDLIEAIRRLAPE
jgi:two-component system chemotaxis response regulator CheB